VDYPTFEMSSAEAVVVGVASPIEITHVPTISTGVTTANTSASSGTDRKSFAISFLYIVSSFFNS